MIFNLVVEGHSDEGAAEMVVRYSGHQVGRVIDKRGKSNLDPDIPKYNEAARFSPWIVFRDTDGVCPVELRQRLTQDVHHWATDFQLRLAHSMTEAWLLADSQAFATFFQVSEARVSRDPDSLPHAKREVLHLCASSRSREMRAAMVAQDGDVGPLYVARINEFARTSWRVAAAIENSPSLRRTVDRLRLI